LAENVRMQSYGGRGLKLLKNCQMIFERSQTTYEFIKKRQVEPMGTGG